MPNVPALTNVARLSYVEFLTMMNNGRGQMPSFPSLSSSNVTELYALLGGTVSATNGPAQSGRGSRPRGAYPPGFVAPTNNFKVAEGGYGLEHPDLLAPPWSTITAYDLNKGTIKWHVALGNNASVNTDTNKMTGRPSAQSHQSMIVVPTGIVFATCGDGRLYAYDADNGSVIWSTRLPHGGNGLPSMYEVNGRAYIAICTPGGGNGRGGAQPALPPGYVVYGLPEGK